MKKLISIICVILSVLVFASCSATTGFKIKENGSVIVSSKTVLTEEEYITFQKVLKEQIENIENENVDIDDLINQLNLKKETVDGKTVYMSEQAQVIDISNLDSMFDNSGVFLCGKFTKTDMWGRPSATIGALALANAILDIEIEYPCKIKATNGTLKDNYTVNFGSEILKGNRIYATTEKSTAAWTKGTNIDNNVKLLCENFVPQTELSSTKLISQTASKVKWDKTKNAKLYEVYRKDGSKGKWKLKATTSSRSYVDQGLKKGVKYFYKVRGKNNYYTGAFCEKDYVKVISGKAKLYINDNSKKVLTLEVDCNSYIDNVEVFYSKSKKGVYKKLKTTVEYEGRYELSYYNLEELNTISYDDFEYSYFKDFASTVYVKTKKLAKGTYYLKARGYQKYAKTKWFSDLSSAKKVVIK